MRRIEVLSALVVVALLLILVVDAGPLVAAACVQTEKGLIDRFAGDQDPSSFVAQNSAAKAALPDDDLSIAKQQVLGLELEWVAAEDKHDAVTLRRILDDKFLASFGAGKPYDKGAFIREIISGDVDPTESQTLTDQTVIVDGDTAIVVGTDTLRGTRKGAPYTEVYRYTVTYIRRNGLWVALAEHLVEAPPTH